jgi:Tfp pilus tip-associated adhesin PilY1
LRRRFHRLRKYVIENQDREIVVKTNKLVLDALGIVLGVSIASVSHGAAPFDPSQQPYGTLPPLTITGFNLSGGAQKAFQVWFDGNNWAGDVVAYPISPDGKTDISTRLWSASDVFQSKQACGNGSPTDPVGSTVDWFNTGRKVVTRNTFGSNKPFRWGSIPGHQSSIGDATTGPKILNYIRGDRINEKENVVKDGTGTITLYECGISSGTMRGRTSIMGDTLHGKSVYVASPPGDYQFDSYQTFKTANAARAPRFYAGGNDGMVHAFNADTGDEVWAYIPSMLIPKLNKLVADPYTHTYFVDGGLVAGDVNAGSAGTPNWKTLIVGGMGAGGKGLFGLDVTSPDAANETYAALKILWEITPATAGFADLGDTYGDPVIVRLNTGEWAAIVGNGYNNTGSGKAVLYVINAVTGALIKSFAVGSAVGGSPNGLSSPVAIDINFDGMVDRVYAGDIDGNMWKFDIEDPTASNWTLPGSPLNSTGGKAIIGAPDVAAHPVTGYLVYFTTGRLFDATDAADSTVMNYAYGIWDGAPVANNTLLNQTLTGKTQGLVKVRVTSGLPINWTDASDPSTKPLHYGWRTALPAGERVLGTGFVRDARYHFSSVNPTVVNAGPPHGENWLNEFDYLTGGVGNKLIFDLNSDSLLTDADRVPDANGVPIAGPAGISVSVYRGGGLLSQPVLAILSAQLSTTIFNSNPFFSPGEEPANPRAANTDPGVSGGHFDSDIYDADGKLDHTHEYDDEFDVTGINLLAPSDPVFNISNIVPNNGTKFKILIVNQKMSPAVNFSYGGLPYKNVTNMATYTTTGLLMASLPVFTRNNVTTLKYNMPKDAFKVKDWAGTGDVRVGLMPTQTGCVNSNGNNGTLGPAPNLLHHNGALTFQVVKDTTPDSAVTLADAAGDPAYGYRVKTANREDYLFGEWTVFWHHPNGECFHEAGWVKDPPEDLTPSTKNAKTPAAGSEDPPLDTYGNVVGATTTTAVDPDDTSNSGKTIRTTITTYSTGVKVIIREFINNKGKVQKIVITTIAPPGSGGNGAPPVNGISQALSTSNTVTGYQQTRNSGKLGRVSWHELFMP